MCKYVLVSLLFLCVSMSVCVGVFTGRDVCRARRGEDVFSV